MIVFVTGGTGKLGQAVVARLQDLGHQPLVLSRKATAPLSVQGDLLDPNSYIQALRGAQAVVHLAALTHSTSPDDYYTVNAHGTEVLLEACRVAGVKRFVHVSTRAVGKACGAYGESKALAEQSVRQSGLNWTILRPSEVYMDVSQEAIGRMIDSVRRSLVTFYASDSRALLAPVHRDDVVAAITAAIARKQSIGNIYVLAGPEEYSQIAFLRRLTQLFSVHRVFVPLPLVILRCAAFAFSLLRLKAPPFVPDQIPRMLCSKEMKLGNAQQDLNFAPRDIEHGVLP